LLREGAEGAFVQIIDAAKQGFQLARGATVAAFGADNPRRQMSPGRVSYSLGCLPKQDRAAEYDTKTDSLAIRMAKFGE